MKTGKNLHIKIKTILVILLLVCCFSFTKSQTILTDKDEHDYGYINYRSDSKSIFTITNAGEAPLIISDIKYNPYNIKIKLLKKPIIILPGDSFLLKVQYNSKRTGNFDKDITIISNDKLNPEKIITLTGRVRTPAPVLVVAIDFAIWIFLYVADYRFYL